MQNCICSFIVYTVTLFVILGRANPGNSGFRGPWTPNENVLVFPDCLTEYYEQYFCLNKIKIERNYFSRQLSHILQNLNPSLRG